MTIASQTSRITYTGDGVTTAFAIPFYFQLNADIVVYLQDTLGNAVLQLLGTNYNLTGATIPAGGTCTFVVAPTTAYLITIYRDPPMTQTASYNNNDPFPAKSHEAALDKALTISQRTRDLSSRSIRLSDAESAATTTALAAIAVRKNRLLGFDTNGALVYVVGPTFVGNTSTGVAEVDTRAAAQTLTYSLSVNVVQTHGATAAGDGGGLDYVRGIISSPTPWQDAGGVYWTPATVQPLNVLAIGASSIVYAKIQNEAATTLLGNPTGAPAAPSEISVTGPLAFAGTALTLGSTNTAHGVALFEGTAAMGNTGAGVALQTLVSGGPSADPSWKTGVRVLLNTLTASNSATLSDTTSLTSAYAYYELVFDNILPATNNVSFELQVHSGGTFPATVYLANVTSFSNGSATVTSSAPTTFIPLSQATALPNSQIGASGIIRVSNPSGTAASKLWSGTMSFTGSTLTGSSLCSGLWNNTAAVDGFQVLMSSGNITSGTVKIYGCN